MCFSSCDLATPGSPIRHTFRSPLMRIPSPGNTRAQPPTNCSSSAFFTSECPKISGAMDADKRSYIFDVAASWSCCCSCWCCSSLTSSNVFLWRSVCVAFLCVCVCVYNQWQHKVYHCYCCGCYCCICVLVRVSTWVHYNWCMSVSICALVYVFASVCVSVRVSVVHLQECVCDESGANGSVALVARRQEHTRYSYQLTRRTAAHTHTHTHTKTRSQ